MIPLFDSLTHPTLTGQWLGRDGVDASFSKLSENLKAFGFAGACAVGMAGLEGYSHAAFMTECKRHPSLIPVAGVGPDDCGSIEETLVEIRALGFRAIKIHPRFAGYTKKLGELSDLFSGAGRLGMTVFYCTYMHCGPSDYPDIDPFYSLVRLIAHAPNTRVVLVHGGDVELLKYAELARFNPNLLLDLSMTIMKYEGSSIDADIRFLFERFDRRICIGSDHPEHGHASLVRRFQHFAAGLSTDKLENIASRNLLSFLSPRTAT